MMKKVFNWSEVHSERIDFLQNPYFKKYTLICVTSVVELVGAKLLRSRYFVDMYDFSSL